MCRGVRHNTRRAGRAEGGVLGISTTPTGCFIINARSLLLRCCAQRRSRTLITTTTLPCTTPSSAGAQQQQQQQARKRPARKGASKQRLFLHAPLPRVPFPCAFGATHAPQTSARRPSRSAPRRGRRGRRSPRATRGRARQMRRRGGRTRGPPGRPRGGTQPPATWRGARMTTPGGACRAGPNRRRWRGAVWRHVDRNDGLLTKPLSARARALLRGGGQPRGPWPTACR